MNKFTKYIVLTLALFSTISCNEWFDVSPKSNVKAEDLFATESGFEDVMIGCYSLMATEQLYGKDMTWGLMDVLAGYYPTVDENTFHNYYYAANYRYDEPEVEAPFEYIWCYSYKALSNVNAILKYIEPFRDSFINEADYSMMKGEAYALRAFLHFDICRLFGPIPESKSMGAKAAPYMTDFTNVAQPSLTMVDYYGQLLKDIDEALNLMREYDLMGPSYETLSEDDDVAKSLAERRNRLNYYATVVLKARVAQYFGDKTTAMIAIKELLPTAEAELPEPIALTVNATERTFKEEQLFTLDMVNFEEKIASYFGATALELGNKGETPLYIPSSSVDAWYSQLSATDNDYRLANWFSGFDADNETVAKFKDTEAIPMLHISELYYIAAECASSEKDRYAYLNKIRAHRGLAPISLSIAREAKNEFLKEFMGEGQAFFYFKRTNSNTVAPYSAGVNISAKKEAIYRPSYPVPEMEYGKVSL